jgi:cytochrome P450 PksS
MLAAANFDPHANPHAEKLDLARKPNRHLAFGTGIHFASAINLRASREYAQ